MIDSTWRHVNAFPQFRQTPHNPSNAFMSLRIKPSPLAFLKSNHRPLHVSLWCAQYHGWCGISFVVLCAPQAAKEMNYCHAEWSSVASFCYLWNEHGLRHDLHQRTHHPWSPIWSVVTNFSQISRTFEHCNVHIAKCFVILYLVPISFFILFKIAQKWKVCFRPCSKRNTYFGMKIYVCPAIF